MSIYYDQQHRDFERAERDYLDPDRNHVFAKPLSTFRNLLANFDGNPHDIDLEHADCDIEYANATMSDFCLASFTAAGLAEFADVLDAEVDDVFTNRQNWITVILSGCEAKRVSELSLAQAGYCPSKDYDRWFSESKS